MPNEVSFDHDGLDAVLGNAQSTVESTRGGTTQRGGIDQDTASELDDVDRDDDETADEEDDVIDLSGRTVDEAERIGEESAGEFSAADTEVTAGAGGGGGGSPLGGGSPMASGGASAFDAYQSATPPMQMNPMQYANFLPTPATATQFDVTNAPNKAALSDAIYQAVSTGNYGDGSDTSQPRRGGGSLDGPYSDDEYERLAQEVQEKWVASGTPYAWGGGHGPEPGMTQGIRDGGHADKMGDYAKTGLDCSGYSRQVTYETYGVDIGGGTAADQYSSGRVVSAAEARPGDLYFPDSAGRPPMHVQVYAGGNTVSEAQQSGTEIMFSNLESGEFIRMVD